MKMDIHSLISARQIERHRGEKPLDAVIRVAKEEAEADQPINAEAVTKAKAKAKAKQSAQAVMEATLAAAAAEARRKKVVKKQPKQQGDLGVGDSDGQGNSDRARYSDPAIFMSEVKMFGGKATAGRRFPHESNQR